MKTKTLEEKFAEKHEETLKEGVVIRCEDHYGFYFKVEGDTVYVAKPDPCMACGEPTLYHLLLDARKQPEVYGFLRGKEIILLDPSRGGGSDVAEGLKRILKGEAAETMEGLESALKERRRLFFEPDHGIPAYMVKIKEMFEARSVTYAEHVLKPEKCKVTKL